MGQYKFTLAWLTLLISCVCFADAGGTVLGNYAPGLVVQKNYLQGNPGAESNSKGWARYADAAAVSPVDCTGGAASISFDRTTATPLSGSGSFILTKDAANRQGNGASYAFSIDEQDKGGSLSIYYDVSQVSGTYSGGTATTDSDLEFYIYDVTNSRVIQPSAYKVQPCSTGISCKGQPITFQASIDSTSYRLCSHVATTSASAYVVKFDSFQLGRANPSTGPPASDYVSYAATASGFGTVTGTSYYWARVSNELYVYGKFTTGTVAGTTASVTLPPGLVIDSTKISQPAIVGEYATVKAAGTGQVLVDATSFSSIYFGPASGSTGNLTIQTGSTISANTVGFSFWFHVPITGWSSNQITSSEGEGRPVAAIITGTPPNSYTANNPIIFPTVSKDTHNGYSNITGKYTVPQGGFYQVSAFTNTNTNNASMSIYVNAAIVAPAIGAIPTGLGFGGGSGLVFVNAGDTIDIRQTANWTVATSGLNGLSIQRVGGFQQISASESVNAIYTTAAGQSITNNTDTTVVWGTLVKDSHGGMNTSTGVYTVPAPGTYDVTVINTFGSNATGVRYVTLVQAGSASNSYRGPLLVAHAAGANGIAASTSFNCKAGDTIVAQVFQTSGGALALSATASQNIISIKRTGN